MAVQEIAGGNRLAVTRNGIAWGTWGSAELTATHIAGNDRVKLRITVHSHDAEFTREQLLAIAADLAELAEGLPPEPRAILCGGATASDQDAVRAFAEALSQPTTHGRYLAILRLDDSEPARAAVRDHDAKCCRQCGTHTMPHMGCILR